MAESRIRAGVGGWTFEPWRGSFYPPGLPHARELAHASRHLTAIEINGTYYSVFKPATFAQWRDATPDGFVFSLKAPRFVTNRKLLATAADSIERFLGSGLSTLGAKLGPINWQLPPNKAFDADDVAAFLALLPRELEGRALRHALEVRHESFDCDEFVALARQHEVAVIEAGDSDYPRIQARTAAFSYLRVMGTKASAPKGYAPAALSRWGDHARALATDGDAFF